MRPFLRPCPCCYANGEEKIYLTKEVVIGSDCEFETGYTVRCIDCGLTISDEYQDEVVRLWNGEPKIEDSQNGDAT